MMADDVIDLPVTPADWHSLPPARQAMVAEAWAEAGRPVPTADGALAGATEAEVEQVRETMALMGAEWHRIEQERGKWKPTKRLRMVRDKRGRLQHAIIEELAP